MKRTKVSELQEQHKQLSGQNILLKGWVHTVRRQSKFAFLVLREITGTVQVFIDQPELLKIVETLPSESVVQIEGMVKTEKQAPGGFEILATAIEVLSKPVEELPFQVYEKGEEPELPLRLDYRWLDLRKPKKALIFKIWTSMGKYMREFWEQEGFIEIKSPKLLGIPSEGGAEAFEIEYFGKKAYLAQSPQFYKQMAMAAGFEKIFEIGPVFRAEKSFTYRHATEFTGIDMEISFVSGLEDLIQFQERWLVYWIEKVKERWGKEILETFGREVVVPETPFPRLTIAEVKKILGTTGSSVGTEEETQIGKYVLEKYKHEFVLITKWPWESRPFYHKKMEGQEFSESFDLLWGGLETTTCAVREHRYDVLLRQAKEKGLTVKNFEPYLRFFKYGCPPHGGMGLGMERLLLRLLGLKNIREVAFVARDPKRLAP